MPRCRVRCKCNIALRPGAASHCSLSIFFFKAEKGGGGAESLYSVSIAPAAGTRAAVGPAVGCTDRQQQRAPARRSRNSVCLGRNRGRWAGGDREDNREGPGDGPVGGVSARGFAAAFMRGRCLVPSLPTRCPGSAFRGRDREASGATRTGAQPREESRGVGWERAPRRAPLFRRRRAAARGSPFFVFLNFSFP